MTGEGSIAKKTVVLVTGGTVVLVGVALLVLPGPGMVVIPAGLGILATEFVWARRLLKKMKREAGKAYGAVMDKLPGDGRGGPSHPPDSRPPSGGTG